ncbi:MAG: integrase core domain-containing protein [Gammaproteobacteria bacterium]|nr:integrase core domain-containing protein [Gammaproteobacteria bacterium]
MKDAFLLAIHLISLIVRLLKPGGMKAVAAENLLLKQQLLIVRRSKLKAPNLTTKDRFILGWLSILLTPARLARSAIIIRPSTLLSFHKALVKRKYLRLFSSTGKGKPGPKGPNSDLIKAIVEIKQRNPRFGCPHIAHIINNTFGIDINKDVVRRVLMNHYHPRPNDRGGPSWLSFIANMKDSLWSIDLFCCESITLKSHWVLVVMDVWSRKLVGLSVNNGPVDGPTLCRMFNQIISNKSTPQYISSDNDPLFQFHRWKANLRILEIEEVKSIPFTPISHPYVERVIGTIRRECLDQTLFWSDVDLQNKLDDFTDYYNNHRVHASLNGEIPAEFGEERLQSVAGLGKFNWKTLCRGLVQLPIPA